MSRFRIALVRLLLIVLVVPGITGAQDNSRAPEEARRGGFWMDAPDEAVIESLMRSMSDEEMVGQLFLVGWPTTEPTPELMRWIRERNIGGIKIFGWNGNDLPTLASAISEMQNASLATPNGIPLFTATDQEGGWVRHVKDGTSLTPGNMAIGASGLPYDAYQSARLIGRELRALGINMNFAPTVDVYVNPEAHVIGPRAFSSDPVETALLSVAYYRGLEEQRVIATAKHFPGHGNATGDSHGVLPVL
ncbi:MAG: glycoside hydrolase family 3 N-terminal domain-containing protein, partial [Alkalispirochaetaceae bacterium]